MNQGRKLSGNTIATTPSKQQPQQQLPTIPSSSASTGSAATPTHSTTNASHNANSTNNGMLTPSKRSASTGSLPPIADLTSPKTDEVRIPKFRGFVGGSVSNPFPLLPSSLFSSVQLTALLNALLTLSLRISTVLPHQSGIQRH